MPRLNNDNGFGRSNMPQQHQENIMDQDVPQSVQEALGDPDGRIYREANNSCNLNVPEGIAHPWPSLHNTPSFSSSSNINSGNTPPEPVADSSTDWDSALQVLSERLLSIQGGGQVAQNPRDQVPIGPSNTTQDQFYPRSSLRAPADPEHYQGRRVEAEHSRPALLRQLPPVRAPRVPQTGQRYNGHMNNFESLRLDPAAASEATDAFLDPPYLTVDDHQDMGQNGADQPDPASSRLNARANGWAAQRVQQPPAARVSNGWSGLVGSTGGDRAPVPHATRYPVHRGSNMPSSTPQHAPNASTLVSNATQHPPNGPSIVPPNSPRSTVQGATVRPGQQGVFLQSNAGFGGTVMPLNGQPGPSSRALVNATPGPSTDTFRPMTAVHQPRGINQRNDPQRALKLLNGISLNYAGDASIPRNQSANIPDSRNCAMWITNLPADVTYNTLLGSIRGMGRIYATHINPPDKERGHKTAAAKLVFFDLEAAQRFYIMASQPSCRFIVQGMVANVQLNRIKSDECNVGGNLTRVLIIKGHPTFVNREHLLYWFSLMFQYDLDEIITMIEREEMGQVRVLFGSYRSQAQAAYMALTRSFPVGQPNSPVWSVKFDRDPCA